MPDEAQEAIQNGDTARVQSTCSDMALQAASDDRLNRVRMSADNSGVDILPIPPALRFPYPEKRSDGQPERVPHAEASQNRSSDTTGPPKKSHTTPMEMTKVPDDDSALPATPSLVQRVKSAPLKPDGPKKSGTERPTAAKRKSSLLQRIPTWRGTSESVFFNPNVYPEYQESSDEDGENDAERPKHQAPRRLQRHSTTPSRIPASNPYRRFAFGDGGYQTRGHVSKHDGRLNISLRDTAHKGYLAKALGATLDRHLAPHRRDDTERDDTQSSHLHQDRRRRPDVQRADTASTISNLSIDDPLPIPKLNIVVMVIGSRGDIQPFLRLGKLLKEDYGHRVRIATHPTFKKFVEEEAKLEFFDIGGDPAELMAFMVKNPGLIPKSETLTSGEIPRRRAQMFEMFQGFWRACISSSDRRDCIREPFVADAIIANPPCFAHIHCAERLGIPLHLMFTFPNTPTQQFPHPLTNIRQTNVDANYTNFISYPLVEMMHWQGLGDLINEFRVNTLGLDPMSMLWAPGQLFRMKVPYSYLWSPGLIPKPPDWGSEINITGFVFLDLASNFKPPEALAKFLDSGEPPVYIGFGSIVVDDPDKFTHLIFDAVRKAGVRALVSKGWGGIGGEENTPDNVFLLDNTPHDWLFPRVSAVVHHGGAGTTAIGLKCGKPTMIVPFFGDQPFWGAMVAKANAGAEPVPYKELSADKLADGIKLLLTEEKQKGAKELADKIDAEGDGAVNAVKSFHKHLPRRGTPNMRCSLLRDRVAAWHLKGTEVRLSSMAAQILVQQRKVTWSDLRLERVFDWNDFEGPGEPLTGAGTSLMSSLYGVGAGIGKTPYHWGKILREKDLYDRRQRKLRKRDRDAKAGAARDQSAQQTENNEKDCREGNPTQSDADESAHKSEAGDGDLESKLPRGNEPDPVRSHSGKPKAAMDRQSVDENPELRGTRVAERLAIETGKGIGRSIGALAKLPVEATLALARGFHNAPRLYGDDTVRTGRRITGFHSGCRAAGSEFAHGVIDGVTGLVRQPYYGAKYDGVPGFFKGVGKGVGGFFLKDAAALFGLPAYTLKGVHKEMIKHRQPTAFIRRARIVEGAQQYAQLDKTQQEMLTYEVFENWKIVEDIRLEIRKTIQDKGFRGRVQVWRNKRWLKEYGIVENMEYMQRALDSHRDGRDWEIEFREEKERHQREQAHALQNRKDARKKKYEKDEKGKRMKGADMRMKTRHGTYRALKKGAKRSEKATQRSVSTGDVPLSVHDNPNNTVGTRPRGGTNMGNEATGTAVVDQALSRQSYPSTCSVSKACEDTSTSGQAQAVRDKRQSKLFHKARQMSEDSNKTLVQPADGRYNSAPRSPKTVSNGLFSDGSLKPIKALKPDTERYTDRNTLPRTATA